MRARCARLGSAPRSAVVDYCFTSTSLAAAGHGAQREGKHAVVFAATNDAAEAAINDSFPAAGAARPSRGKNNGATTIDSFTALQPRLSTKGAPCLPLLGARDQRRRALPQSPSLIALRLSYRLKRHFLSETPFAEMPFS